MEVLIIGKPAINIYLPLVEFPQEGDVFIINSKNESVGSVSAVAACLLAKWGIKPHFTGVVGNDGYAEKIRNVFSEYKINTKFMETNFEHGTANNYFVLNTKSGVVTKIIYNDPNVELEKYKYDFQPDWAIMDGTDTAGAMALLNNDNKVKTVFYARRADQNTITLAGKCKYVVCTQAYAEGLTKVHPEDSAESYVNLYQKIVDVSGKNNVIVILNNRKILYCEENKVKVMPEMQINISDSSSFDSVFTGTLSFALMHDVKIDEAIKFANTAAAISLTKIGEEPAIPTLDEVLDNSGLRDQFKSYKPQEEAPVEETPQEGTEQATPEAQETQESTPSAFDQTPVEATEESKPAEETTAETPAETPAPEAPAETKTEEVTEPPHEETNIFG